MTANFNKDVFIRLAEAAIGLVALTIGDFKKDVVAAIRKAIKS